MKLTLENYNKPDLTYGSNYSFYKYYCDINKFDNLKKFDNFKIKAFMSRQPF